MAEWNVLIEATAPDGSDADTVLEEQVDDLLEVLPDAGGRGAVASAGEGRLAVRFFVTVDEVRDAFDQALETWEAAVSEVGLPAWPIARCEIVSAEELDRSLDESPLPPLVGVAEVADLLGVSKQRVSELARDRRWPRPLAELAATPVWSAWAIRQFADRWPRRPGRPPSRR